jgi:hypothetical protein
MEASIDGVASKSQKENPSQHSYTPLIILMLLFKASV